MSNIDINLIRALDGAAPQHKASNANKFELTEGSDGAQHVKIVDSEDNVQDKISVELPDKQIVTVDNQIQLPTVYPDKAVEARLQAIEQTQSQILHKLKDTIDTRHTVSIGEYTLPAEMIGNYIDMVDLLTNEEIREQSGTGTSILVEASKYKGFNAVWIRNTTDKILNFRLYFSYLPHYNGNNMYQLAQIDIPSGSNIRIDSNVIEGLDTSTFYAFFNFRFKDAAPTSGFVTAKAEAILR